MHSLVRRTAAAGCLLLSVAAAAQAQPRTREQCEAAHPASWGDPGKDVPWVPTFDAVVLAMLSMAQVTERDLVVDLGAGDGRIAIAAAKPPFGARAVGIEYDPALAKRAACLAGVEELGDRVRIVQGDVFAVDFGAASVVTMYLLPQINRCLLHRLLALEPGTRVVSHQYGLSGWKPERSVQVQGRDLHLWVVPARVDGAWDFEDSGGRRFAVELSQALDALSGEVASGSTRQGLLSATLHGRELRFAFDAGGAPARFSGTVRGAEITGVLVSGSTAHTAVGRLRGALRDAPWAAMLPDCRAYYER